MPVNANVRITVDPGSTIRMMSTLELALMPYGLGNFLVAVASPYLRERAQARFHGEGDSVSGAWAPLAPYTQEDRERRGFSGSGPINKRTGELERFVTEATGETHLVFEGAELEMPGSGGGEVQKKFQTAQQGLDPNPIPGFNPVPPRPVLAMNEQDTVDITRLLGGWLEDELSRLGGFASV